MPPRLKKLIGLFILLPGLLAYIFAAIVVADYVPDFWLIELAYFIVAGVLWALPMKYLVDWMNKDPSQNGSKS
ncbi:MAG: DUF2842 domain-containing protein [Pseudomonadota bacterium]|nr:DUF2842 domain-containing protein [Pseudomonadota bacterium]